jgi:hypothetical protein
MGRGVARQTLELLGDVDHPLDLLVLARRLDQPRLEQQRLLQGRWIGRVERHQLRHPVDLAIGEAQRAADIAQHGARLQLAEGDDAGDPIGAVLVAHVADHLVAPVLTEIDVEVGHRDPLGVQEALEQQAEAKRVQISDRQCPGDHRARARAAPRPDRDALLLGPLDEVGDDQEVAVVLHALDHLELVVQTLAVGPGGGRLLLGRNAGLVDLGVQARLKTGLGLGAQLLDLAAARCGRKGRQDRRAVRHHEGAAPRDRQGVVDRLGQIGEQQGHLGRALEAVLGRQPAALGLRDLGAVGDAQEDVVGLVLLGIDEVGVVGCDQRQVVRQRDLDQGGLDPLLIVQAMAHQLDVEAIGEGVRELADQRLGEIAVAGEQGPANRPFGAAGERDQALARLGDIGERQLGRGARIALQMRPAQQPQEIAVARLALDQDRQQRRCRRPAVAALVGARDRQQAADHRLDAGARRALAELEGAEQVGPIRDRHRRRLVALAALEQPLEPHRALEQRIAGADAKMDERRVRHQRTSGQTSAAGLG